MDRDENVRSANDIHSHGGLTTFRYVTRVGLKTPVTECPVYLPLLVGVLFPSDQSERVEKGCRPWLENE